MGEELSIMNLSFWIIFRLEITLHIKFPTVISKKKLKIEYEEDAKCFFYLYKKSG